MNLNPQLLRDFGIFLVVALGMCIIGDRLCHWMVNGIDFERVSGYGTHSRNTQRGEDCMTNTGRNNSIGNRNNSTGNRNFGGNSGPNRNFSGGQSGGNFNANAGTDYYQYIKNEMEFAIQQTELRLNALQMAYNALDGAEGSLGDQNNFEGSGDRQVGLAGNRNFADGNDPNDGRAEGITTQELNSYLREGSRNDQDGSYDLRTKEGRALKAAGWVTDEGFPIQGRGRMFINNNQMSGR